MTEQEIELLDKLAECHNLFIALPKQHPGDIGEWVHAIHQLQRIVATRTVRLDHPEIFYIENNPIT